jgi:hypothetical protein
MSTSKERKLIDAALTKIRRVAEQIHDDCLLYFIDMAIAEVASKSSYRNNNDEILAEPIVTASISKDY